MTSPAEIMRAQIADIARKMAAKSDKYAAQFGPEVAGGIRAAFLTMANEIAVFAVPPDSRDAEIERLRQIEDAARKVVAPCEANTYDPNDTCLRCGAGDGQLCADELGDRARASLYAALNPSATPEDTTNG